MRVVSISLDVCVGDDADTNELCKRISSKVEGEFNHEVLGYSVTGDVTEDYRKMGVIL